MKPRGCAGRRLCARQQGLCFVQAPCTAQQRKQARQEVGLAAAAALHQLLVLGDGIVHVALKAGQPARQSRQPL